MCSRFLSLWFGMLRLFVLAGLMAGSCICPLAANVVKPPDPALKLDPFYKKFLDCGGIAIVASDRVPDVALHEAAYVIRQMLAGNPALQPAAARARLRVTVMGYQEWTTDIPEYRDLKPKHYWDARARGLGGMPLCSGAEENLLNYPGDPYASECILMHEFAHSLHEVIRQEIDPEFDRRLRILHRDALEKGLWRGTYAGSNHREYFAEGVQSWFDYNRENDDCHPFVNTRAELRAYDPALAELLQAWLGDLPWRFQPASSRLDGHLRDYQPTAAPTFSWPQRLLPQHKLPNESGCKATQTNPLIVSLRGSR